MNLKIWMLVFSCTFKSVSVHAVYTAQIMKFSIKNFFGKCDQICQMVTFTEEILSSEAVRRGAMSLGAETLYWGVS